MPTTQQIIEARAIRAAKAKSQLHTRVENAHISATATAFGITFCGIMSFFDYWLAALGFTVAFYGSIQTIYFLCMIERKHVPKIVVRDDELEIE